MKFKQLLAAALLFCTAGAWAQTDVTNTYITNADFSSMTGWTEYKAASFVNIGSGLIGTFKPTGSAAATVDATHLNTEYCIGFQARWNTNYTAYQQTTAELPVGHYELSYDVEDVNNSSTKINYDNLFYVEVGGNKIIDTKTEWMNAGKSSWTTHTISFDIASATTAKISLGYGNKEDKNTTPIVYVSHLKLTWTDPEAAAHAAALDAAKYTLDGYIKKATALNGVLSNATLATAIETAQGQYNEANDWAEDFDNTVSASTALNSAITSALSSATPVALNNGTFDSTPNNTLNGDGTTTFGGTLSTATSNPDNTKEMTANTGDHGYLYEVTGWTQFSKFNSTAAQGTTSEYGTAMPANGWSTNSTTPPATDMLGSSEGAALHLSAGWNDQGRYQQKIENLPTGRYILYYEVINLNSNTGIASNYIGVNGNAGDFYGTTDKFVYSGLKTIEQGVWQAQAFEFDVAKTTDINFSVGVTTSTGGSGNGAKLWIDNFLVYRIGDVIVTDADANDIISKVTALDESVYNADEKSALATAKATFEGSKTLDNYNALNTALVTAQASVAAYKTLKTAITNVEEWSATAATTAIRSKYTNGEYADDVTAADIYEAYQAAEIAALAADSKIDYTSVILNHSFETGDMTGWGATSRNDTGVKEQSNGTYSISNDVDGSYLFNSWGGSAENDVYQTIKNLPAGTYTLSALLAGFKGEKLILAANETTNSVTVAGDKTTGYTVNVVFTLADAADVVIKASSTKSQEGSDASFIKADNFRLAVGDVTAGADDYADLNTAIAAAEAKTLGFQNGEYAPYNNVAALKALAAAKAIDQNAKNRKEDVEALTATLNDNWTANDGDVDAIYNGLFATVAEGKNYPDGWTRTNGWGEMKSRLEGDFATAYYNQPGSLQYGNQGVYTMPLAANTAYQLTFSYRSHENNSNQGVTVSVLNGEDGMAAATFVKNSSVSEWADATAYFTTGAAGNYVLTLGNSGNTWMTNVSLMKFDRAASIDLAEDEGLYRSFERTYAKNVTVNRTVKTGFNTVCMPFDMTAEQVANTFGDQAKVYTFQDVPDGTNSTINFNTKAENTIEANVPVLIGNATASTETKAFNNVMFKGGDAVVAGTNFDFVGTYAASTDIAADDYFIGNGAIYKSTGATTIKAFRAYIKAKTSGAGVKMFVDGIETAISEINGAAAENGAIRQESDRKIKASPLTPPLCGRGKGD